ncbi:hypothetical protein [Vreelandella titanicae]|nr:hypothetical protein [Halomonas titanicae]
MQYQYFFLSFPAVLGVVLVFWAKYELKREAKLKQSQHDANEQENNS